MLIRVCWKKEERRNPGEDLGDREANKNILSIVLFLGRYWTACSEFEFEDEFFTRGGEL